MLIYRILSSIRDKASIKNDDGSFELSKVTASAVAVMACPVPLFMLEKVTT